MPPRNYTPEQADIAIKGFENGAWLNDVINISEISYFIASKIKTTVKANNAPFNDLDDNKKRLAQYHIRKNYDCGDFCPKAETCQELCEKKCIFKITAEYVKSKYEFGFNASSKSSGELAQKAIKQVEYQRKYRNLLKSKGIVPQSVDPKRDLFLEKANALGLKYEEDPEACKPEPRFIYRTAQGSVNFGNSWDSM